MGSKMYEVGSTVVNTQSMKQGSVCAVIINENILEEKGWDEPKIQLQYVSGLREWVSMSQVKTLLIETDPTGDGECLEG